MDFRCPKCHCLFQDISPDLSGEQAHCEDCDAEFVVPIPDSKELLYWAENADWERLEEGHRTRVARGHSQRVVRQFIQIFEKRREQEIWRLERESQGEILSQRERIWQASEKRLKRRRKLENLQAMTRGGFRHLIADLFSSKGFETEILEKSHPFDIQVSREGDSSFQFVRCFVRSSGRKISSTEVRKLAAHRMKNDELRLFTSSSFSRPAKTAAAQYPWLTLHDARAVLRQLKDLKRDRNIKLELSEYDPVTLLSRLESNRRSGLIGESEFKSEKKRIAREYF